MIILEWLSDLIECEAYSQHGRVRSLDREDVGVADHGFARREAWKGGRRACCRGCVERERLVEAMARGASR